ncbi:hypothetical protein FJT64_011152 [Amphibalanus amphitrite]|uniref:Uncharacterized protein n=1 Tax=Amphibalanus amphitrite TaxID=1232801 RepID=A0A6A4VA89_AMPAM|nr:hypothetical protein FJT64_011152 [Amphibalanus amphitrite]
MTPSNILSGFRATGIFPLDSNIFPEESFAAESVFIPQVVGHEDNNEDIDLTTIDEARCADLKSFALVVNASDIRADEDDGETIKHGYQSVDTSKTLFKSAEGDVFAVPFEDIICRLQEPTTKGTGRKAHVRICGSVDTKEM